MNLQSNQLLGILVIAVALLLPKLQGSNKLPDPVLPVVTNEAIEMMNLITEGYANALAEGSALTDKKDYELNNFMLGKIENIVTTQTTRLRQTEKEIVTKDGVQGLQNKWKQWSESLKNKKLK